MLEKIRPISFSIVVIVFLLALGAAGCAGSEGDPALIGAYPAPDHDEDYTYVPEVQRIVYTAVLELTVKSVSRSAEKITDLAHSYGGYVNYANVWYEDGAENATVEISVPVRHYGELYERILRLGTLERETVRGELEDVSPRDEDDWLLTTITVHLSERSGFLSRRTSDSRAAATFWQAFEVTATLFGYLFDAAIWVLVVAGPFVLLWWGGRKIWRRAREFTGQKTNKESQ